MSFVESPSDPALTDTECTASPAGSTIELQLHRPGDDSRAGVEQFIAGVYRDHFDARLTQFMPVLVSGRGGALHAAAGYRDGREPLFVEQYLPRPVEAMLAAATGRTVDRSRIVEIGQFASRQPGAGRRLIDALAHHLVAAGYCWAVITATAELRRLLARRRLLALALGAADPHCLGAAARQWGSYYRHAPKVLAGDLVVNLARLGPPR